MLNSAGFKCKRVTEMEENEVYSEETLFSELDEEGGYSMGEEATNNHGTNAMCLIHNKYNRRMSTLAGSLYYWTNKRLESVSNFDIERSVQLSLLHSKHSKTGIVSGTCAFIKNISTSIKNVNPVSRKIFMSNGVVDLTHDDKFFYHSPGNRNTFVFAWEYQINAPEPIEWFRFLRSAFAGDEDIEDKILAIQEFLGWSLISDNLNIQKAFVLRGSTRSGKGTILSVLRNLYGESDAIASLTNLSDLIDNKPLSRMMNSNIAIDHDAKRVPNKNASEIIGVINKITANEAISVKLLYEQTPVDRPLNCKLAFACNALPTMIDDTGAITGRYHQIIFNHSFLGREDSELPVKLKRETALIGSWAVEGLKRLMVQKRFTEPESSKQAALEASEHSQPLTLFINECLAITDDCKVHNSDLYACWKEWCHTNGEQAGSKKHFCTSLNDTLRSKKVKRANSVRMGQKVSAGFVGVGILASANGRETHYPRYAG